MLQVHEEDHSWIETFATCDEHALDGVAIDCYKVGMRTQATSKR